MKGKPPRSSFSRKGQTSCWTLGTRFNDAPIQLKSLIAGFCPKSPLQYPSAVLPPRDHRKQPRFLITFMLIRLISDAFMRSYSGPAAGRIAGVMLYTRRRPRGDPAEAIRQASSSPPVMGTRFRHNAVEDSDVPIHTRPRYRLQPGHPSEIRNQYNADLRQPMDWQIDATGNLIQVGNGVATRHGYVRLLPAWSRICANL